MDDASCFTSLPDDPAALKSIVATLIRRCDEVSRRCDEAWRQSQELEVQKQY